MHTRSINQDPCSTMVNGIPQPQPGVSRLWSSFPQGVPTQGVPRPSFVHKSPGERDPLESVMQDLREHAATEPATGVVATDLSGAPEALRCMLMQPNMGTQSPPGPPGPVLTYTRDFVVCPVAGHGDLRVYSLSSWPTSSSNAPNFNDVVLWCRTCQPWVLPHVTESEAQTALLHVPPICESTKLYGLFETECAVGRCGLVLACLDFETTTAGYIVLADVPVHEMSVFKHCKECWPNKRMQQFEVSGGMDRVPGIKHCQDKLREALVRAVYLRLAISSNLHDGESSESMCLVDSLISAYSDTLRDRSVIVSQTVVALLLVKKLVLALISDNLEDRRATLAEVARLRNAFYDIFLFTASDAIYIDFSSYRIIIQADSEPRPQGMQIEFPDTDDEMNPPNTGGISCVSPRRPGNSPWNTAGLRI